jgi:hypothetical protein
MHIYSFESKDKDKKIRVKKVRSKGGKWDLRTIALWAFRFAAVGVFFARDFIFILQQRPA